MFITIILFVLNFKTSSAFKENESVIYPIEVTTKNLKDYVDVINKEVLSFCSYDDCIIVKDKNINKSIKKFEQLYNRKYNDEELEIINVKGYPITKIVVNT